MCNEGLTMNHPKRFSCIAAPSGLWTVWDSALNVPAMLDGCALDGLAEDRAEAARNMWNASTGTSSTRRRCAHPVSWNYFPRETSPSRLISRPRPEPSRLNWRGSCSVGSPLDHADHLILGHELQHMPLPFDQFEVEPRYLLAHWQAVSHMVEHTVR